MKSTDFNIQSDTFKKLQLITYLKMLSLKVKTDEEVDIVAKVYMLLLDLKVL